MRVLVVEDDERLCDMLRRGLTEDGYLIDVAGDGDHAIEQALGTDYDAIVLDVMLPGTDGFEVCRRLRSAERRAPVLLLTARTHVADRVRGLDSGADDYLPKPFGFAELSARLRALVRRGSFARPTVLRAGDLTLNPASHSVRRGNNEIPLSAREFALLEFMLRHPGEVLIRDDIYHHVWTPPMYSGSNVVDQYMSYLRRKIDKPFGVCQLETLRGVGYRLRREPIALDAAG